MVEVTVARQILTLLPGRAIWWQAQRTLLIADAHIGKAATFRALGVPVPHGTTADTLGRATALIDEHSAERVVFLGDLLHAREGRSPRTLAQLAAWREAHGDVELLLVRGNHDRRAGDPPDELGIRCVDEPHREGALELRHYPADCENGCTLAGHIHPAVKLRGRGRQRLALPCFWFRENCLVLPSFGDFTGSAVVEPAAGDRVFVIADGAVIEVD